MATGRAAGEAGHRCGKKKARPGVGPVQVTEGLRNG